jgi:hypothetical protein
MRRSIRSNPSTIKSTKLKIAKALKFVKKLNRVIKKTLIKAAKIQKKIDAVESKVVVKSIVTIADADAGVKHAVRVGRINERQARKALEKALQIGDTTGINPAKMNLKKVRLVKELSIKKAQQEKYKMERLHRKKIRAELKKAQAKKDRADKIRRSAKAKLAKYARAINKLSLVKGNEQKIKNLKAKMTNSANIKAAATKMKITARTEILKRLTPLQQRLLRSSSQDATIMIQKRIRDDAKANVSMITETITVYDYQLNALNKKIKNVRKSSKS